MSNLNRKVKRASQAAQASKERSAQLAARKEQETKEAQKAAKKSGRQRNQIVCWISFIAAAILFAALAFIENYTEMWVRIVLVCVIVVLINLGMSCWKKEKLYQKAEAEKAGKARR